MRILLDHGAPKGLAKGLIRHQVITAYEQGWDQLQNGDLLRAAEASGYELLITTDRRIRYQQNLEGRSIAILVLTGSIKWSRVRLHMKQVAEAVDRAGIGSYVEFCIPYE